MRNDGVLHRQWEDGNVGQAWEHCTGRVCGDSLFVRKIPKNGVWKWEGKDGVKTFVGSCAREECERRRSRTQEAAPPLDAAPW